MYHSVEITMIYSHNHHQKFRGIQTIYLVQYHTAYARVCLYDLFTKFFQVKVKVSFFHNVFIELMMRDPAISDYYIYNVSLSGLPTETAQVVICTLVCCHSN